MPVSVGRKNPIGVTPKNVAGGRIVVPVFGWSEPVAQGQDYSVIKLRLTADGEVFGAKRCQWGR